MREHNWTWDRRLCKTFKNFVNHGTEAERVDFIWFNPDVGAFESQMCNAVIWPFEGGVAPEQWHPTHTATFELLIIEDSEMSVPKAQYCPHPHPHICTGNTDKVKGQIYSINSALCGLNWVKAESVPGSREWRVPWATGAVLSRSALMCSLCVHLVFKPVVKLSDGDPQCGFTLTFCSISRAVFLNLWTWKWSFDASDNHIRD